MYLLYYYATIYMVNKRFSIYTDFIRCCTVIVVFENGLDLQCTFRLH